MNGKYLKDKKVTKVKKEDFLDFSSTWKEVLYGTQALSTGLNWRLGDYCSVMFWTDPWFDSDPL